MSSMIEYIVGPDLSSRYLSLSVDVFLSISNIQENCHAYVSNVAEMEKYIFST